jgi:hypothetical protein
MLNEVKHLGLEHDSYQFVGVRFFAVLRMTSLDFVKVLEIAASACGLLAMTAWRLTMAKP